MPYRLLQILWGRDFSARYPDEIWLSDITYIWTWEGWVYLSVVMDVFNREIVGWAMHDRLKKELVHRNIFDYIEIFYNRQRRHSALNYMSPLEYYREAIQT